jgi:chemotaxis response regulator CheB
MASRRWTQGPSDTGCSCGRRSPVNRHKPSMDMQFKSATECAGRDALAIILTGMGASAPTIRPPSSRRLSTSPWR